MIRSHFVGYNFRKRGNKLRKHIVFASLLVIFVVGGIAAESSVSAQITGGYGDLSVKDKDAKSAAAFAVKSRSTSTHKKIILVKILKAETQVVAGSRDHG